jgi:hypothetical protein
VFLTCKDYCIQKKKKNKRKRKKRKEKEKENEKRIKEGIKEIK